MVRGIQLVPAQFRFIGEVVMRVRRIYYAALLSVFAGLGFLDAVWSGEAGSGGAGTLYSLGLMAAAAPLCRSWVGDDVRLGFGAWWLQKPVRAFDLYLARQVALVGWAGLLIIIFTGIFGIAASLGGAPISFIIDLLVAIGWLPVLLVVLAFLGSALGARNAALFAYGLFLASAGIRGVADSLQVGLLLDLLIRALPPYDSVVATLMAMASHGRTAAIPLLLPMLLYILACAVLGLAFSLTVPRRLAGHD